MNRRGFLKGIGAVIGGIAIDQAIPFNRVWSFPKEIVIPQKKYMHLTYALGIRMSWELIEDSEYVDIKKIVENIKYTDEMSFRNIENMCFSHGFKD